ncbi:MAG TPA: tetratricopeptide repeat protein [Burkholderiales bacterium]|nr:tetratricopeptide repeat protein [Burkholderiales bacterium]
MTLRRVFIAGLLGATLSACLSPTANLLLSLIPDGTFSALLGNMKGVDTPTSDKLAELGQKEDWQGIAALAQENINKDPTHSDWWIIYGYSQVRLNQLVRANQAFAEAVRLAPDDIDGWNLYAESFRAMGQPERAIRTLNNALSVTRDSPMSYFVYGKSYGDLKMPQRAMQYYQQALERQPQFAEAWYEYGRVAWSAGDRIEYSRAVQALQRLNPSAAKQLTAFASGG